MWAQWITTSWWITFFDFIASMWDTVGVVIISLGVLFFLYTKWLYLKMKILIMTMLITVWSSTLVKFLVERARPENRIFEYHWHSFPSGHTTMSVLFYWLLLFFVLEEIKSKIVKNILILCSFIVCFLVIFSRVYLSLHWVSDIIGGFLLGGFWLLFGIIIYKKMQKK